MSRSRFLATVVLPLAFAAGPAMAAPVDLSTWTREGPGTWNVQPGNDSVIQTLNGNPTVFYSDFNSFGNQLSGSIRVNTTGDDDFIGFVIGFNPGDLTAAATNFLLVDWKQLNQGSYGCAGDAGLAVSLVTGGLPAGGGAWCHQGANVTELQRGATLGATGWADNTEYTFDLEYTSTNLKVFVDGNLELDVNGAFTDGRFGFYNYSQERVEYAGITQEELPVSVPAPATLGMMIFGVGMIGGAAMRRKKARSQAAA